MTAFADEVVVRRWVEQAFARGRTCEQIVVELRDLVDSVWQRMEAASREVDDDDDLAPCGTHAAYVRHRARGEIVDQLCVDAERDYSRARHPAGAVKTLAPCGSHAAYTRHRARGEAVDEACLVAERTYSRDRHRAARARAAAAVA